MFVGAYCYFTPTFLLMITLILLFLIMQVIGTLQ